MPGRKRFRTFKEFYPFYLEEHSKLLTRILHYAGTISGYVIGYYAVSSYVTDKDPRHLWLLALAPAMAFGINWLSHLFVEGNAPASFKWPIWSTIGDHKMMLSALLGLVTSKPKVTDNIAEETPTV